MATKPTAAQSALRILWIMVHRCQMRENGALSDGNFLTTFPRNGFTAEDFQSGIAFAVEQGWVERLPQMPGVRLTTTGFSAAPHFEKEPIQSMALRLLAAINARTWNKEQPIFAQECAPALGITDEDAQAAWRYLRDKGLIQTYRLDYAARINANGADLLARAEQHPDQATPGFGSVTYNTVHVYRMENSTVQQGGAQSTQIQNVNYGQKDFDDLRQAVQFMEEHFAELQLNGVVSNKAAAQLATLKAQLTDEPNPVIVREAGRTLRNLTEGAIAGLISAAIQPGVWHFVSSVFTRLFGG